MQVTGGGESGTTHNDNDHTLLLCASSVLCSELNRGVVLEAFKMSYSLPNAQLGLSMPRPPDPWRKRRRLFCLQGHL